MVVIDHHVAVTSLGYSNGGNAGHPLARTHVEEEAPIGTEGTMHVPKRRDGVRVVEVAERVEQAHHAIEESLGLECPHVAEVERAREPVAFRGCARDGEEALDEIDAYGAIASSREFVRVPPVPAAEIEDAHRRSELQGALEETHLSRRILFTERIGHEVEVLLGIEDLCEVEGNGAQHGSTIPRLPSRTTPCASTEPPGPLRARPTKLAAVARMRAFFAASPARPMNLEPGQIVDGKYRIVRLLGKGAMGAVFEGENVRIRRRVAIKVLHAEVAERGELVRRFVLEAQAAGRIGSQHIVEVLDLGELPDGARYLVMEFLEGESLRARIPKRMRVAPSAIAPLLRQLLEGLHAAHEAGIVHRDLKPDNVFVLKERAGRADFVKILDFGISKFEPVDGDEGHQTRTGVVMGTPYYMSPEQARGVRALDRRSDLFSVGVMFYEAVTGRLPFEGETFNELMFKIALQDAPAADSIVSDLDPGIARILRRALARDPAGRFATAAEFAHALDAWLDTSSGGRVGASEVPARVESATTTHPAGAAEGHPTPSPEGTNPEWSRTSERAEGAGRRSWAALVVAVAVAALVVVGVAYGFRLRSELDPRSPASPVALGPSGDQGTASATTSTTALAQPSTLATALALGAPSAVPATSAASVAPATSVAPRAPATTESERAPLPSRASSPAGETTAAATAPASSGRRVRTF